MKPWDLSSLNAAPTGRSLQTTQATVGAKVAPVDSSSKNTFNEQIDANLTIITIVRVALALFGVSSAIAAINTDGSTRHKLQCTLSAACCAVASVYYQQLYAIRRTKLFGYSRAGNAAVDSVRYSVWAVTNGILAWLALLIRGPFEPATIYGWKYPEWLIASAVLSSASVLISGSAQFCVESARYAGESGNQQHMIMWVVLAAVFVATATTMAGIVSYAIHFGAPTGAESMRNQTEIDIGRSLGLLWITYPAISVIRVALTLFTKHRPEDLLGRNFGMAMKPVTYGAERARDAIMWALRIVSHSHAYAPIAANESAEAAQHFGAALLPAGYLQMFDIALSICDVTSVGLPALACVVFALPVYT